VLLTIGILWSATLWLVVEGVKQRLGLEKPYSARVRVALAWGHWVWVWVSSSADLRSAPPPPSGGSTVTVTTVVARQTHRHSVGLSWRYLPRDGVRPEHRAYFVQGAQAGIYGTALVVAYTSLAGPDLLS